MGIFDKLSVIFNKLFVRRPRERLSPFELRVMGSHSALAHARKLLDELRKERRNADIEQRVREGYLDSLIRELAETAWASWDPDDKGGSEDCIDFCKEVLVILNSPKFSGVEHRLYYVAMIIGVQGLCQKTLAHGAFIQRNSSEELRLLREAEHCLEECLSSKNMIGEQTVFHSALNEVKIRLNELR